MSSGLAPQVGASSRLALSFSTPLLVPYRAMENPLLDMPGLPPFGRIQAEHVEPAIDALLARNRARIADLTRGEEPPTWERFIEPLELLGDTLERAWSPVGHLNAVMNSEALRAAYNACLPKLSAYGTELGQNRALFEGYRAVAAQEHLDATQRQLLNHFQRHHLSGNFSETLGTPLNLYKAVFIKAHDVAGVIPAALNLTLRILCRRHFQHTGFFNA